jgi:hypothetical protein
MNRSSGNDKLDTIKSMVMKYTGNLVSKTKLKRFRTTG